MPHPSGWVSTHPSTALSSSGRCTKCHSSSFCTACHGVDLPHSSAFVADHPNHVYSSGSICMKCHGNGGTGPEGCWGGQCHTGSINDAAGGQCGASGDERSLPVDRDPHRIAAMFGGIASRYDLINRIMTGGRDRALARRRGA